jgi:hypothetical protein
VLPVDPPFQPYYSPAAVNRSRHLSLHRSRLLNCHTLHRFKCTKKPKPEGSPSSITNWPQMIIVWFRKEMPLCIDFRRISSQSERFRVCNYLSNTFSLPKTFSIGNHQMKTCTNKTKQWNQRNIINVTGTRRSTFI